MHCGERIRYLRELNEWTQDDLAKKLGYASRSSVNKVENSEDVSIKKARRFARALQASPAFILGLTNDPIDYDESEDATAANLLDIEYQENRTDPYYVNPATAKMAQEIYDNKELSMLFDAARNSKPEDLKILHDMAIVLRKKENGEE